MCVGMFVPRHSCARGTGDVNKVERPYHKQSKQPFSLRSRAAERLRSCFFLHLRTPSTDFNGMVFSPKCLVFSPFAVANFLVVLVRSSFTRGNISAGMTCPAAAVSSVALMSTQLSLTSMTFLGDAQELFQHSAVTPWQISSSSSFISCWRLLAIAHSRSPPTNTTHVTHLRLHALLH